MGVGRCQDRHGDYEGILVGEGRDEGGRVIIVDFSDFHGCWKGAGAVFTGNGCDGVFSSLEQFLDHEVPDMTTSLVGGVNHRLSLRRKYMEGLTPTMATFWM